MAIQITSCVHVLPAFHWLSYQRSDTGGHSSEQEATAASQLYPGELGSGRIDHVYVWIHSNHLLLHDGLFFSGTYWL